MMPREASILGKGTPNRTAHNKAYLLLAFDVTTAPTPRAIPSVVNVRKFLTSAKGRRSPATGWR